MKTRSLALLLTFICAQSVGADYSVVVSKETQNDPDWKKVVDALLEKHAPASVVIWDESVNEALETLRQQHPRYTCFVAKPSEAGRQFVADVHQMTRRFDNDPYTDTRWGILTGFDAKNALAIASHEKPLVVNLVASGTEIALEMCQRGIWYDELVKHKTVSKDAGGQAKQEHGPGDTTRALADTLTEDAADLFVTSGHATERDWQIGFRYKNGSFRSKSGQMFGVTSDNDRFRIRSANPKVYLPIGNCLMGHIDGPDAMALAWMNDVGVRQMLGYTVLTWYGYGGWGVLDYFVEQPGRYTLGDAFHANHHALIHRLDTYFDGIVSDELADRRAIPQSPPNQAGKAIGLTPFDSRGLLWDRDTVAFYGDPAWEAKMAEGEKAYGQELTIEGDVYTLTITPNRGSRSFEPVNTNGAQRGWRPMVELLDHRIGEIKLLAGQEWKPVITDDFILVPNPRVVQPDKTYQVKFTATKID